MLLKILLDRRAIYTLIIVVIIVPFFITLQLPIHKTEPAVHLFEAIDRAIEDGKPILISMDFDASVKGECQPMAEAVMRHVFAKKGKVIVMTFLITAPGLCREIMRKTADEYDAEYGKDYVFLGFKPQLQQMILGMGKDITSVYPVDADNTPISQMDVTRNVKNFDDIGLVLTISGTDLPLAWITYAEGEYGAVVGVGTTAVAATQYSPFLQSKQIKGLLPGINGALTYEKILLDKGYVKKLGDAGRMANTQSAAHIVIILFVVVGNIVFFISKRRHT